MAIKLYLAPWYRVDDDRYINLTKLTDVSFYGDFHQDDFYAICRLENGSQCRIAGSEARVLKTMLENCNAANLINCVEYEGLARVGVGRLAEMKRQLEEEEIFTD
ncbi:hypothetical protein RHJ63_08435 [Thermosynechococcus sp. JY1334]|uniref:hypothetical protein n=1 Tax=unclassified Thermosynechococcus TaxID=2622553 RepID=UPI0026726599|nr:MULTISPECIES: hypothetical protein [unclassified Thermosynechococcus]MDR7898335.1 hypothetical protein [Thermosynechococcus sp. JY1332]MDR7905736.1 hypothetical protein [Thermosynechococcus sp. JY1334]WKT85473.1 hypothetical protein QYC30_08460 [Thermosynechococcus sp. JY1339]WNC54419.1 hypothetical protein RHJ31_08450 [Thermosynechococcus sp. JY1331]